MGQTSGTRRRGCPRAPAAVALDAFAADTSSQVQARRLAREILGEHPRQGCRHLDLPGILTRRRQGDRPVLRQPRGGKDQQVLLRHRRDGPPVADQHRPSRKGQPTCDPVKTSESAFSLARAYKVRA